MGGTRGSGAYARWKDHCRRGNVAGKDRRGRFGRVSAVRRPILDALARDPQKALADIAAERARRRAVAAGKWSFAEFAQNAWSVFDPSPLRWNWYLQCLADHLEAVAREQLLRLVGNGPPRLGKSN